MLGTTKLVPVECKVPITDRRKSFRLTPDQGALPVAVTTDDGHRLDSELRDISAGGIRVGGRLPASPRDQVKLSITLSEDVAPYEVAAQVVHVSDEFTGLRYVI